MSSLGLADNFHFLFCSFANCELRSVVIIDREWVLCLRIYSVYLQAQFRRTENSQVSFVCAVWLGRMSPVQTILARFLVAWIFLVMLLIRNCQRMDRPFNSALSEKRQHVIHTWWKFLQWFEIFGALFRCIYREKFVFSILQTC